MINILMDDSREQPGETLVVQAPTREIKVGRHYRIHGSDGWAGIIPGVVRVYSLVYPKDSPVATYWKNVLIDSFVCGMGEEELQDKDNQEYLTSLKEGLWVLYEYVHVNPNYVEDTSGISAMPLDLFADHITVC